MSEYYIVISYKLVGSFIEVLFLLLPVISSELHKKPRRKDLVTSKSRKKNLCERHHLMVPIKIHNIAMSHDIMSKILLQFNTNWFAYLRTWYYFKFCFSSTCSCYDLTVIKKRHTLNCYLFLQKYLSKINSLLKLL